MQHGADSFMAFIDADAAISFYFDAAPRWLMLKFAFEYWVPPYLIITQNSLSHFQRITNGPDLRDAEYDIIGLDYIVPNFSP